VVDASAERALTRAVQLPADGTAPNECLLPRSAAYDDGALYVTSAWSMVKAYDAATGRKLWDYDPKVDRATGQIACCDVVNRGVAASKPAQVASKVIPGAMPISPDEAYRAAEAAVPGAFIANMNLPTAGRVTYRMGVKFPEDRTPGGRSRVAVDQYSEAVLDVVSTRSQPLGTRILNLKRSIHTGDVFGWPSQALAFLVSLSLAGQVVTGFLIWWKPGKLASLASSKAERAEAATAARVSAAV